jgi:hypothetical protein
MGNGHGADRRPGMREIHIMGLISYIVQVFDETCLQLRTIPDASTSISNRLKNCRRFALQPNSSPNPQNRYFFNNQPQVLINEKYRDADGINHWAVVLQLTPDSKIIQIKIYDPRNMKPTPELRTENAPSVVSAKDRSNVDQRSVMTDNQPTRGNRRQMSQSSGVKSVRNETRSQRINNDPLNDLENYSGMGAEAGDRSEPLMRGERSLTMNRNKTYGRPFSNRTDELDNFDLKATEVPPRAPFERNVQPMQMQETISGGIDEINLARLQ